MRNISCKKNPKSALSEKLYVIAVWVYDKESEPAFYNSFCFSLNYFQIPKRSDENSRDKSISKF